MKKPTLFPILVAVLVGLLALPVFAQDEKPTGQLYSIHEDIVKPSMVAQYESAVKDYVAEFVKHKIAFPYMQSSSTNDFHYFYLVPLENFADLDKIKKAGEEFDKKLGEEKRQEFDKRFAGTYEYHQDLIARMSGEYSYQPEAPRLKPEEATFLHWTYLYIKAGKEKEANEIARQYKALYASKKIADGYNLYIGEMGTEMPLFVVVSWAKSASDFFTQQEKIKEMLGEEGQALAAKAMAVTRKFVQKTGRSRPDISYMPEEEITAK
ncbi:MAG: hypothetical protein ACE5HS_12580 [bacterium]